MFRRILLIPRLSPMWLGLYSLIGLKSLKKSIGALAILGYRMLMDFMTEAILRQIERRGLTETAVSREAVGNPNAIKNLRIRRGTGKKAHPIDNLIAVAEYLDLEIYIGPRRPSEPEPQPISEHVAVQTILKIRPFAKPGEEKAQIFTPFTRALLRELGVEPAQCSTLDCEDESMSPEIPKGGRVLLDHSRKSVRNGQLYGVVDPDGGVVVRRLERTGDHLLLKPDNPRFLSRVISSDDADAVQIIGRVAWNGHPRPAP